MSVRVRLEGQLKLNKPLSVEDFTMLKNFNETRHEGDEFPSIWCQWVPTSDGMHIEYDGNEGFSEFRPWLMYLIENLLEPKGYKLSGVIHWDFLEDADIGTLYVVDSTIRTIKGQYISLEALEAVKPGEVFINTVDGEKLVFPSSATSPSGVDYVRVINDSGDELMYWDSNEWMEDPRGVMGAILGAMMRGAKQVEVEITDGPEEV